MTIRNTVHVLFIVLILLWVLFAILRMGNYAVLLFAYDLPAARAGELPRERSYVELKNLAESVKINSNENFVFSTENGRDFFLLRYFSYPKKVYWLEEGRVPDNVYLIKKNNE